MIYTISNNLVSASISSMGAELYSLYSLLNDIEYLWQGNPNIWSSRSPILFPIVGRLKESRYELDGENYSICIHGFAKQMEFSVISHSDRSITFSLSHNETTLISYPYYFELQIKYTLEGNQLKKEHIVINHGDEEMFFELGGHEGYAVALFPEENMKDYYLDFGDLDSLEIYTADQSGLINKEQSSLPLSAGHLHLDMELFRNDFLTLNKVKNNEVTLANSKNQHRITVSFADFPYLGIWTKNITSDSNYICIEPWSSLPDGNYLDYDLKCKEGVRVIKPNSQEKLSYIIRMD